MKEVPFCACACACARVYVPVFGMVLDVPVHEAEVLVCVAVCVCVCGFVCDCVWLCVWLFNFDFVVSTFETTSLDCRQLEVPNCT